METINELNSELNNETKIEILNNEKILLYKINNLQEAIIEKRPSKYIKTPYVADIKFKDINNEINFISGLGHCASLGCGGLSDKNAKVLIGISPFVEKNIKQKKNKKQETKGETKEETKEKSKEKLKCSHIVYLAKFEEIEKNNIQIIGIYPKLAEIIVENALKNNYISSLRNIKSYRRETKIYVPNKVDSRFDFSGIDENGIPFLLEVKNVPLADYEDCFSKVRKNMDFSSREYNTKVAYFPDGYRKKTEDPISPRALKHIRELTLIKKESRTRCINVYVIQRTDINRFQISIIDPIYRQAVKQAKDVGVELIAMVVSWNINGECYFIRDDLPITPFD